MRPLIQLFVNAYKSEIKKGVISQTYNSLHELSNYSTKYVKERWEKEGGQVITEEEWQNICSFHWKSTKSHVWKEFCWKSFTRFFITPAIKAHYDEGSCECWRNCGTETAHHYHIFWDCKNIKNYWREVHKALQNIFGTYLPYDFKSVFLGYISPDIKGVDKHLFGVLLAASKKALTKKRLTQDPPTLNSWIDVTFEIYNMEKITFLVNLEYEKFVKHWGKWFRYMSPIRPDIADTHH